MLIEAEIGEGVVYRAAFEIYRYHTRITPAGRAEPGGLGPSATMPSTASVSITTSGTSSISAALSGSAASAPAGAGA